MLQIVIALLLVAVVVQDARPPRPGVKTLGVKIPIERLKPDAVFPYPGSPDWIAIDESVWISNFPNDSVTQLDPKTNKVIATIVTGKKPCSAKIAHSKRDLRHVCGFGPKACFKV